VSFGKHAHNHADSDTHPSNARFSTHDSRIDCDSVYSHVSSPPALNVAATERRLKRRSALRALCLCGENCLPTLAEGHEGVHQQEESPLGRALQSSKAG
jgi:hypothetical protein